MRPIVNLCATIHQISEGKKDYLGCLQKDDVRRFGLLPIRNHARMAPSDNFVRLDELLMEKSAAHRNTETSSAAWKSCLQMSMQDRLYLAVCMASSLLQLYNTRWIGHRWSSQDISFLRQLPPDSGRAIREPFVSKLVPSQRVGSPSTQPAECRFTLRNPAIFDLGILLIELCFCKPLHSFWEPDDLDKDGAPNKFTALSTAQRLLPKVYNKAGVRYGDAVRRCIRCEFDQIDESLENDSFRLAVYSKVVLPLEDDLRDFGDETILRVDQP